MRTLREQLRSIILKENDTSKYEGEFDDAWVVIWKEVEDELEKAKKRMFGDRRRAMKAGSVCDGWPVWRSSRAGSNGLDTRDGALQRRFNVPPRLSALIEQRDYPYRPYSK